MYSLKYPLDGKIVIIKNIAHQNRKIFIIDNRPPINLLVEFIVSFVLEYNSSPYPIANVINMDTKKMKNPTAMLRKALFSIFIKLISIFVIGSVKLKTNIMAIKRATISDISAITPLSYPILKKAINDNKKNKSTITHFYLFFYGLIN